MALYGVDPTDDDQSDFDAQYNVNQARTLPVTSDTATRVGQIYRQAPYIPANVILGLAKAGASPAAVDTVSRLAATQAAKDLNPTKKEKKSWFQRNIADKAKTVTRWAFAGLNFVPEVTQNVASQVFNPNNPAGFDGWFASTSLGTLMLDDERAGSGFFLGGEAAENQAARARRVRGTINGNAWTIGRGAASRLYAPGSKPYAILSGFVDASVNVLADPTLYGGKVLQTQKAARNAIPSLDNSEVLAVARKMGRAEAGLESTEVTMFNQSKFGQWVNTNRRAQRLVRRIGEIAADDTVDVNTRQLRVLEAFDYKMDPALARMFAEAGDETQVKALLGEASAKLAGGRDVLLPSDVRDIKLSRAMNEFLDTATERVPFARSIRNSRWLSQTPKGEVVINGTGLDKAEGVKSYTNYLRGIGYADDTEVFQRFVPKIVQAFSEADPVQGRVLLQNLFDEVFEEAVVAAQGDRGVARKAVNVAREKMAKARQYNIDDAGFPDDGGMMKMLLDEDFEQVLLDAGVSPDKIDDVRLVGPGLLSELADDVQILPDFRQMRRTFSNTFVARALKKKPVEQSAAIVEFVQQEVWKPLTLATGGYIMRNMFDAQVRIAVGGLSGFLRHPFDYLQWVMGRKGFGDILGSEFDTAVAQLTGKWDGTMADFAEAVTFQTYRHLEDTELAKERALTNGNFYQVRRASDPTTHTNGYVDNLGLLAAGRDPLPGIYARLASLPEADRRGALVEFLQSPSGKTTKDRLEKYFRNGLRIDVDGQRLTIPIDPDKVDEAMFQWVDRLVTTRVNTITRGDADLNIVVGSRRVPVMTTTDDGVRTVAPREVVDTNYLPGEPQLGDVVEIDSGEGVVTRIFSEETGDVDPFTGAPLGTRTMVEVQPVYAKDAFEGGLGSPELRQLIDMKGSMTDADGNSLLAEVVKVAGRGQVEDPKLGEKVLGIKNEATDWFFNRLYGTASRKLESSPVFRQFYYREVGDNVDLLAPVEAQRLLDDVGERAAEAGLTLQKYMGGDDIVAKLREQAANAAATADGTVEQLDEYAKMVSLYRTKKLLYNATERNNLEDILRVVVPFGSAWKEVLGTYIGLAIEDPTRIRKAQLVFNGGVNFDPDGDGQGFFYRDPTTGEYSFNFPLSGELTELLTGLETPLQAPVKRLSIGLGVIPSIGPVAQIAASKLIPDTPAFDGIVSVLMPYGRVSGLTITPTWLTRLQQAISANPGATETIYANTYIETMRALAASGEYDLSNPDEQNKLYSDARGKARTIAMLRTLGQFLGPTSPSAEFVIPTDQGDVYGSMLVKEFQRLQSENYDTSVQRFIEIYGDNAMIYLSNKTESQVGGLEATEQFGEWERDNGTLLDQYKRTAGFMAPGGDDFSFEVWSRQMRAGKRRRLTDREVLESAQDRMAAAQYRELRNKLPANPSDAQKAWLRNWRVELNRRYPGFPVNAEFNPGEFPNTILELEQLVQEPSLQDNDVARATAEYLDARKKAFERAAGLGLKTLDSQKATPLREWLADYGRYLSSTTPEFARLWDRVLSGEVEQ